MVGISCKVMYNVGDKLISIGIGGVVEEERWWE